MDSSSFAALGRSRSFGRRVLITFVLVALFLLLFGRLGANFLIDQWWFAGLGQSSTFWTQWWAKFTMFIVAFGLFFAVASANLYLADRATPEVFSANVHPIVARFHELLGRRLRAFRYLVAGIFGLMLAAPAVGQWQSWLLFRHARSFGVSDPQFSIDVGFYVFRLPFIAFLLDWWFVAGLLVLVITIAAHLFNGAVLFVSGSPTMSRAAKVHVAVLLAFLALVRAGDYWVSRYELTTSRRGFVDGATYTVVNAQIPALVLLTLVAILTAYLYLSVIRTNRWRPAVISSVLWLVVAILGGSAYPAMVESFVVRPNKAQRESLYVARNVAATTRAFGLEDVTVKQVEFDSLTADEVTSDLRALRNVRLLDDDQMREQFQIDSGRQAGWKIFDLDVDRYPIDDPKIGRSQQVMVAARELNLAGVPNTSWPSLHLVNTRGCGLVTAPLGKVTDTDRPIYTEVPLERPQLYFSDRIGGYSIVGTDEKETDCGKAGPYEGRNGVRLDGFGRRLTFAAAFMDYNLLASDALAPDSQILWRRDVRERIARVAPFLKLDNDPYPVVVDGGVQWVLDAYTVSEHYPYSQSVAGIELSASSIPSLANYVRNSVKAVVDAYTGDVRLYVMDDADPVLAAWRAAFPDLFSSTSDMPDELRSHLRYPEDLFSIQTNLYATYHLRPEDFFLKTEAWSVAQAPSVDRQNVPVVNPAGPVPNTIANVNDSFAAESDSERFVPYYTILRDDAGAGSDFETEAGRFVMFRPFVPFSTDDSRNELQAYMTASGDPANYGQLTTYVVTNDPKIPGPAKAAEQGEIEDSISAELSLQYNNDSGSKVKFGDTQAVPVADGLVYVRPVFVVVGESTKMSFVIVWYDNAVVMTKSIDEALAQLFPGYDGDVGDRVVTQGSPAATGSEETPEGSKPTTPETSNDVDGLLSEAAAAYEDAQELLADGDLGGYQAKMDEVGELVLKADKLANGPATDG